MTVGGTGLQDKIGRCFSGERQLQVRFKINGGRILFFVISADPPQLILIPPFINFVSFMRDNKEVQKYIIDS